MYRGMELLRTYLGSVRNRLYTAGRVADVEEDKVAVATLALYPPPKKCGGVDLGRQKVRDVNGFHGRL